MRSVKPGIPRVAFILFLVTAIGLVGCDNSVMQPEVQDPDAPMSEAEVKARIAEDEVVVLEPKDYEAFGIPDGEVNVLDQYQSDKAKAANCTVIGSPFSSSYTYSVCTEATTIVLYNVDFFRVTIDAEINQNYLCPIEDPIDTPIQVVSGAGTCPSPNVSVTSTTVRNDGVILQANDNDTGSANAETNFVAVYPQADDFEFKHLSTFAPVNNSIAATVDP